MNPVDALGMRVIGSPVALATAVPPSPHVPPGGGTPPGKTKQGKHGALKSISKLVGLYSPNSLNYGTGNAITTWPDTSGRRFDATDGTLLQRYDSSISNYYAEGNGVREGNAFTLSTSVPLYVADIQQYTVYAVFRPTGSDTPFFSLSDLGGDTTLRLGFTAAGNFRVESTYAGNVDSTQAYALNQWHYIVLIRKSSSLCEVWIDGKKSSISSVFVSCNPYYYHIGSGWYQVFGGYPRMAGDLAEIAWWGKRVSSAERQSIEAHAKRKFKL